MGAVLSICLCACGSTVLAPSRDGGAILDGGPAADGGPTEDGGMPADGGAILDGGPAADGGPVEDGGMPADGGVIENCPDLLNRFQPCGGNVENTWKIDFICLDQSASMLNPLGNVSGCESSTFSGTITESSGEMAFNNGGHGSISMNVKTSIEMVYPDTCLRAIASGLTPLATCGVLSNQYATEMNGTCTYGNGKCTCTGKGALSKLSTFTWSSSTTTLTIQEAGGTAETIPYCVINNVLLTRRRLDLERGMKAVFLSKATVKYR